VCLTQAYVDSGNVPEAMRCALDSLELGAIVPRGGAHTVRDAAFAYEWQGQHVAWKLAARVDAQTARAAVARLTQIEARRWPLPESLREELQQREFGSKLAEFRAGPVYAWEKLAINKAAEANGQEGMQVLWSRAQEVFGGPKSLIDANADVLKQAQERLDAPWDPNRPRINIGGTTPSHIYYGSIPYNSYEYSTLEWMECFYRTQSALLKTRLALRAYYLERGSYPKSLDTLVQAEYLKAVPGDLFSPTRAPLRYQPSGETFWLWSVGPDGVDDGGRASLGVRKQKTGRFPACDVVGGHDSLLRARSNFDNYEEGR